MELPPPLPPLASLRTRFSLLLKLVGIGLLLIVLHVPLMLTHGVLAERRAYQQQATNEIASTWGRQQMVNGPVLVVPYVYKANVTRSKVVGGRAVQVEETDLLSALAYFLPERLAVTGTVDPEVRHRGIYETVVYSSKLHLVGDFRPNFAASAIEAERIDWDKARIHFGVSDQHGLRLVSPVKLADGKV